MIAKTRSKDNKKHQHPNKKVMTTSTILKVLETNFIQFVDSGLNSNIWNL